MKSVIQVLTAFSGQQLVTINHSVKLRWQQ